MVVDMSDVDEVDGYNNPAGTAEQFTLLKAPASSDAAEEGSDTPKVATGSAAHLHNQQRGSKEEKVGDAAGTIETADMVSSIRKMDTEKTSLLRDRALAHFAPKVSREEEPDNTKAAYNAPSREGAPPLAETSVKEPAPEVRKPHAKLGETARTSTTETTSSASPDQSGSHFGHGKNTLERTHPTNLATGKSTKLSNYAAPGKKGDKAVDGGESHYETCTHANRNTAGKTVNVDNQPTGHPVNWWYVDLGAKKLVKEVHVTNTEGEEHKKLWGFSVWVGNSPTWNGGDNAACDYKGRNHGTASYRHGSTARNNFVPSYWGAGNHHRTTGFDDHQHVIVDANTLHKDGTVHKTEHYLGCYTDSSAQRDLPTYIGRSSAYTNNPAACATACNKNLDTCKSMTTNCPGSGMKECCAEFTVNFKYISLQDGQGGNTQCFCGNTYGRYGCSKHNSVPRASDTIATGKVCKASDCSSGYSQLIAKNSVPYYNSPYKTIGVVSDSTACATKCNNEGAATCRSYMFSPVDRNCYLNGAAGEVPNHYIDPVNRRRGGWASWNSNGNLIFCQKNEKNPDWEELLRRWSRRLLGEMTPAGEMAPTITKLPMGAQPPSRKLLAETADLAYTDAQDLVKAKATSEAKATYVDTWNVIAPIVAHKSSLTRHNPKPAPPATPPRASGVDSYVGCFKDNSSRDLQFGPGKYGYTINSCGSECHQFRYWSLQNGGQCFCDNSYSTPSGTYPQVKNHECNKGGTGYGGSWRNAVYTSKITPPAPPAPPSHTQYGNDYCFASGADVRRRRRRTWDKAAVRRSLLQVSEKAVAAPVTTVAAVASSQIASTTMNSVADTKDPRPPTTQEVTVTAAPETSQTAPVDAKTMADDKANAIMMMNILYRRINRGETPSGSQPLSTDLADSMLAKVRSLKKVTKAGDYKSMKKLMQSLHEDVASNADLAAYMKAEVDKYNTRTQQKLGEPAKPKKVTIPQNGPGLKAEFKQKAIYMMNALYKRVKSNPEGSQPLAAELSSSILIRLRALKKATKAGDHATMKKVMESLETEVKGNAELTNYMKSTLKSAPKLGETAKTKEAAASTMPEEYRKHSIAFMNGLYKKVKSDFHHLTPELSKSIIAQLKSLKKATKAGDHAEMKKLMGSLNKVVASHKELSSFMNDKLEKANQGKKVAAPSSEENWTGDVRMLLNAVAKRVKSSPPNTKVLAVDLSQAILAKIRSLKKFLRKKDEATMQPLMESLQQDVSADKDLKEFFEAQLQKYGDPNPQLSSLESQRTRHTQARSLGESSNDAASASDQQQAGDQEDFRQEAIRLMNALYKRIKSNTPDLKPLEPKFAASILTRVRALKKVTKSKDHVKMRSLMESLHKDVQKNKDLKSYMHEQRLKQKNLAEVKDAADDASSIKGKLSGEHEKDRQRQDAINLMNVLYKRVKSNPPGSKPLPSKLSSSILDRVRELKKSTKTGDQASMKSLTQSLNNDVKSNPELLAYVTKGVAEAEEKLAKSGKLLGEYEKDKQRQDAINLMNVLYKRVKSNPPGSQPLAAELSSSILARLRALKKSTKDGDQANMKTLMTSLKKDVKSNPELLAYVNKGVKAAEKKLAKKGRLLGESSGAKWGWGRRQMGMVVGSQTRRPKTMASPSPAPPSSPPSTPTASSLATSPPPTSPSSPPSTPSSSASSPRSTPSPDGP
jgi:hypothetical protein